LWTPAIPEIRSDRLHAADLSTINVIINELSSAENGVVVFSASTGSESSYEDKAWNNGAFTRALVEGLNGQADLLGRGELLIRC